MSRIPHAVLGCAVVAIAVVLAVAGVEWIDTGTAPQSAAVNSPITQRSPFAPVGSANEQQQTVSTVEPRIVLRTDPQRAESSASSRKSALEVVTELADTLGEQAESSLADMALSHADVAVREEAVYALSERHGTIALHTLQQALQDPSPRVRDAAIRALVDANEDDAAMLLSSTLQAEDLPTRLSAIDALGEIGGPEATQFLEQMLQDRNEVVRVAAAEWLAELTVTAQRSARANNQQR